MTPLTEQIPVLPPDEPLDELLAALTDEQGPTTALVGPDGAQLKIPDEVREAVRQVVAAMAQGDAVIIADVALSLTTMDAAELLGLRWPTVRKLLDEGEIPFERTGRFRRVLLTDLLAYRDRRRARASDNFDRMAEIADECGLYETTTTPVRTR